MGRIVCLGEILVDLLPAASDGSMPLAPTYAPRLGGAPTNVAINLSRLGASVSLVCALGDDAPGAFLRAVLAPFDLDLSGLMVTSAAKTTLAVATFDETHAA